MVGVKEIAWSLDRRFRDSSCNEIHVLQKRLNDLNEAKEELTPFFNEISLFQVKTGGNGDEAAIKGILADFRVEQELLSMEIMTLEGKKIHWSVVDLKETILTVWRVNDSLDALQMTLRGKQAGIYIQTGGMLLSKIFVTSRNKDLQINKAIEIFNHNIFL